MITYQLKTQSYLNDRSGMRAAKVDIEEKKAKKGEAKPESRCAADGG